MPGQVASGSDQALLHLGTAGRCGESVRRGLHRSRLTARTARTLRPRHGRRSDRIDRHRQTSVTVHDAALAVPAGQAVGIRVRGRLPAERRARCRRRRRRAGAQRARSRRLPDPPVGRHGRQRRFHRPDDLRHVQPAADQQPGRNDRSGHRQQCLPDHRRMQSAQRTAATASASTRASPA